ncbi:hypothetical protein Dsin_032970 [Dipteronia sinensis]|uniref:Uncharacterized protein n=1 Tax=Dipteronia sinensis TaxID=43782 RepID=A0AAE0DMV3_9ROSI|nr:hypothetical protein Dsin_032970 [Dipteronia sinensis]
MTEYFLPSNEQLRDWGSSKVAIVTGGAQGIGFAIVQLLADAGAKVVIADVDENIGIEATKRCGRGSTFIKCDVTSWDDQVHLFEETMSAHGRIDLVVCNAAINPELTDTPDSGLKSSPNGDPATGPKYLHPFLKKILDVNFTWRSLWHRPSSTTYAQDWRRSNNRHRIDGVIHGRCKSSGLQCSQACRVGPSYELSRPGKKVQKERCCHFPCCTLVDRNQNDEAI